MVPALRKGNARLELGTVEQRVASVTHTRGVIVALVVIGERTPFRAGVNNALTHDEAARTTDHVAGRELLHQIGRLLAAVRTLYNDVEVLLKVADGVTMLVESWRSGGIQHLACLGGVGRQGQAKPRKGGSR
ncbi:hypothetical protein HYQ46_009239 [Verticillium longisporum]|nr:hypothetical protein HYQ46_009239 [Verticillium longisporum]